MRATLPAHSFSLSLAVLLAGTMAYADRPVRGISGGVQGAKEMLFEVGRASRYDNGATARSRGGKWSGTPTGKIKETRTGSKPRIRTYSFTGSGDLNAIEITTPRGSEVKTGDSLSSYLNATKGKGAPALTGVTVHETRAGDDLDSTIAQIKHQADTTNRTVIAGFNSLRLVANPGDSLEKVGSPAARSNAQWAARAQRRKQAAETRRNQKLAAFASPLIRTPPAGMTLGGAQLNGVQRITPAQLQQLPKGTVLTSISGKEQIVGIDAINGDTRGGYLAVGFKQP